MVSAAAAGVIVFAVATAGPQTSLVPGPQSPSFLASAARRAVPPLDEAGVWFPSYSIPNRALVSIPPFPGWPMRTQLADEDATRFGEPPINGRMR